VGGRTWNDVVDQAGELTHARWARIRWRTESYISMDVKWPLYPGSLRAEHLWRFEPVGYPALADGYRLGCIDIRTLLKFFGRSSAVISEPSNLLITFLNTAGTFDRKRDVGEELDRLSAADTSHRPPLWMLLARMIVDTYDDPSQALQMLEYVYEDTGDPEDMKPFKLYGLPPPKGPDPGSKVIASLQDFLVKHGVT
jgi:hypothetical protein